ncbi:MAG: glutaredoxin family protein [Spirochaetales bacterium]
MGSHTEHEELQDVPFVEMDGEDTGHDLTVYTLSTCAFCKRSLNFLSREGVSFRYIHIDTLGVERKQEIKEFLRSRFDNISIFPVLIVDDEHCVSGFAEGAWRKYFRDKEQDRESE